MRGNNKSQHPASQDADINERINNLQECILLLTDFVLMLSLWQHRFGNEETNWLTQQWFRQQIDRITRRLADSTPKKDYLQRFERLFEQMDSLPSGSDAREKV